MPPKMNVEELHQQLNQIREQQGELPYTKARDSVISILIHQPKGEEFLKAAFPDVDLEPYRQSNTPNRMMEVLKAHTPHLKTDIQLQLLLAGNEAFMLAMDSLFAGRKEAAKRAIQAVMDCFNMAERSNQLGEQAAEIPAEEREAGTTAFVSSSTESQLDTFGRLLEELEATKSLAELTAWYGQNRQDLDRVVDRNLRDSLFDQIRVKKSSFEN